MITERGENTLLCHLCDPGDFVVCGGLRLGGRCRRRDGGGSAAVRFGGFALDD
jgi:hypothetical protein